MLWLLGSGIHAIYTSIIHNTHDRRLFGEFCGLQTHANFKEENVSKSKSRFYQKKDSFSG